MGIVNCAADRSEFGQSLLRLRQRRGLTLSEAAGLIGVSRASLSHWECGRRSPSGALLDRLLGALRATARERARLLAECDPSHARVALMHDSLGAPVEKGHILRAMRQRRGMAQTELARAANVGQGTVAKWEAGDLEPSPEALHGVLFALGVSAEEAMALARAPFSPPVESDPEARIASASRITQPLREVALLGIETDLWWLAARDARWDDLLSNAMARRGAWSRLAGRLDEVEPLTHRATRLARSTAALTEVAYATIWTADARLRRGADPYAVAADLRAWNAPYQGTPMRAWTVSMEALALATARDDRALTRARQAVRMVEDHPDEQYNRKGDLAEALIVLRNPAAALATLDETDGREESFLWLRCRATLALGQEPPERWIDSLRATGEDSGIGLYRERAREIEASRRRLRHRRTQGISHRAIMPA